jgi:uncharacterized protein
VSGYDWDSRKAEGNLRKYGVSFEEAEEAVNDPLAWMELDTIHSGSEERYVTIGTSSRGRVLLVITSRGGPTPRIISARRAPKRERHAYERRRG